MLRKIIRIDADKCDGCGLCINACHEGALALVDGKAKLLRDDYCDGLGDCLPVCPRGAIAFEEREAAAYDAQAVEAKQKRIETALPCGCPGSQARQFAPQPTAGSAATISSQLRQWPVQIRLVPIKAPYFDGAQLLVAADCAAYAYGDFHRDFIQGRIVLIGCPKLDCEDASEKLTAILRQNDIASLTVARMEVPCCGGLERAAATALARSGKSLPLRVATISTDGRIVS